MNTKIRHLVVKGGKRRPDRYYWQPSQQLRAAGWQTRRLHGDDGRPVSTLAAAIPAAEALNEQVDAARIGDTVTAAGVPAVGPVIGTIDALIMAYQGSRFWHKLRPSTQRTYQQSLDYISHTMGSDVVRSITAGRIEHIYSTLYSRVPGRANSVLRVLRLLLQYAVRQDLITVNPAARPGMISAPKRNRIWSRGEVTAIVGGADDLGLHSVGTAVLMNYWLGQRQADILALPRSAYADGQFDICQSKTGATVKIPDAPDVKGRIVAELARQAKHGPTLLVCEATGRPWTSDHFRAEFARARAAAAVHHPQVADLQFMWLRHTAVTRLAEAGCTVPEIAAITGHALASCQSIIDRYLVRTADLAHRAAAKRLKNSDT